MNRKYLIALLVIGALAVPLIGQITIGLTAAGAAGAAGGIPVHDGVATATSSIERAIIIAKQVAHIALTVEHIAVASEHLVKYKGEMLPMAYSRLWVVDSILWRATAGYSDSQNSNIGWLDSINKWSNAAGAYINYVDRMSTTIPYGFPLAGVDRLQRNISTMELTDATNSRALGVLSDFRHNQQVSLQPGLENLRAEALNEGFVTEKELMQKSLVMGSMQAQMLNSQNELLSTKLEMDILSATRDRNDDVRAMNDRLYAIANTDSYMAGQAANTTNGLHSLVIP